MDSNWQTIETLRSVVAWLEKQDAPARQQNMWEKLRARSGDLIAGHVLDVTHLKASGRGSRVLKASALPAGACYHPTIPNVVATQAGSKGFDVLDAGLRREP